MTRAGADNFAELDPIDRQAHVLADVKLRRLQAIREQMLKETRLRQHDPTLSVQEIALFASNTQDAMSPDPSKIKIYEKF